MVQPPRGTLPFPERQARPQEKYLLSLALEKELSFWIPDSLTGSRKLRKKNPESGNQSYERNPKDKEPNCVHLCQLINQMVKEIRLAEEPQVWMSFVGHYLIISYRHQPHLQKKEEEGSMLVAEIESNRWEESWEPMHESQNQAWR